MSERQAEQHQADAYTLSKQLQGLVVARRRRDRYLRYQLQPRQFNALARGPKSPLARDHCSRVAQVTEGPGTSSLFEATRLGLSRIALSHADELTRALEQACKASGQALAVERVGTRVISADRAEL